MPFRAPKKTKDLRRLYDCQLRPHAGGPLQGYVARYLAKHTIAARLAEKCEIRISIPLRLRFLHAFSENFPSPIRATWAQTVGKFLKKVPQYKDDHTRSTRDNPSHRDIPKDHPSHQDIPKDHPSHRSNRDHTPRAVHSNSPYRYHQTSGTGSSCQIFRPGRGLPLASPRASGPQRSLLEQLIFGSS
jgi:hypothetical protein